MDIVTTVKTEAEALLSKMINTFEIEVEEEEGVYHVIIKTEADAPTVIGRHGETIRAIQKILEVVLYKSVGEAVHILVNVNDYREKQKDRLTSLASQMADKTKSSHRPTHVRGLSSYERKVVHEYVTTEYPDLTTYSIGEGRDRHLVIDLKEHGQPSEESESSSNEE